MLFVGSTAPEIGDVSIAFAIGLITNSKYLLLLLLCIHEPTFETITKDVAIYTWLFE